MNALPKSVKVRSTCNACQQAKIRCSHEKPSCRRCQKQNIACIYSMSRRLGRPAKKRDPEQERHPHYRDDRPQPNRKNRATRKKVKDENSPEKSPDKGGYLTNADRMFLEQSTLDESMADSISGEGALQPLSFLNGEKESPFSVRDTLDLASDSWLQEFISSQPTEPPQDHNILDIFGISNTSSDNLCAPALVRTTEDTPICTRAFPICPSNMQEQLSPAAYYTSRQSLQIPHETANNPAGDIPELTSSYSEYFKQDALAFTQPLTLYVENLPTKISRVDNHHIPGINETPRLNCDYIMSDGTGRGNPIHPAQLIPRPHQCQCHEQTVQELIRVNMCACHPGSTVTIDGILSRQRLLQQLADTILQCCVCSKSGGNLLMVVVVSIDNLVTAIEAVMRVENGLMEGFFAELQDDHVYDYPPEIITSGDGRQHKGMAYHFKAQVESCPLLVGGFCVPGDEKVSFVLQVLHNRLSGLLNTIRRIRICAQDVLDIPSSRGKLVMVAETDRRLQQIMMKMKMLTGVGG